MNLWVVLFAAILAVPARAEPTASCFSSFANVAPTDGVPRDLIQETYVELMDQLGGALTPETVRRLAESDNPFALPEQPGTDLGTLRRKLADFEAMLASRGWRTEEIVSELRGIAARRAADQGGVRQATEETMTRVWNNRTLSVPDATRFLLSPDGQYLLTMQEVSPNALAFQVTDLVSGQVSREFSAGAADSVRFSSDGKSLLLNVAREYQRIPLEKGTPRFDRTEVVGTSARKGDHLGSAVVVADSAVVYGRSGQRDIRRFDLNRKKSALLKLNGTPIDMSRIFDWGQVDGTNDLYIHQDDGVTSTLVRYAFDARGRGKVVGEPWSVPYRVGSVLQWGREGRYLIRRQQESVSLYPAPGAPEISLGPFPSSPNSFSPVIKAVLPHPQRDEIGVLYRQPSKGTTELSWYDVTTGKQLRTGSFPTNDLRGATLSADGERLIVLPLKTNQIQIVNPNYEN